MEELINKCDVCNETGREIPNFGIKCKPCLDKALVEGQLINKMAEVIALKYLQKFGIIPEKQFANDIARAALSAIQAEYVLVKRGAVEECDHEWKSDDAYCKCSLCGCVKTDNDEDWGVARKKIFKSLNAAKLASYTGIINKTDILG